VTFSVNGGSGSVTPITESAGSLVTLPVAASLVRPGYTLTSWNTAADGSGTAYPPGANVTLTTSTTFYAQWTAERANVFFGVVGNFPKESTALSSGLKEQVIHLAKMIKARHFTEVTLYGYTSATGLISLNRSISQRRATNVADYLRATLSKMKVKGVKIMAAGEGAIGGRTSSAYSRVEVFVE
jgi:outer membrane protein OmpA-like peptidoglycan-associated protein